jgi:hypothetical protein
MQQQEECKFYKRQILFAIIGASVRVCPIPLFLTAAVYFDVVPDAPRLKYGGRFGLTSWLSPA